MSPTTTQTLLLAAEVGSPGAHPAASATASTSPSAVLSAVRSAEDAGAAFVTFEDAPPDGASGEAERLEAGTRAAYVAIVTDRVGLAPRLEPLVTEPFHLATQLASLDWASHGRGAWVVGDAQSPAALLTVGRDPVTSDAARREIREVVEVARALWDSWEDDAIIKDVPTGRFLDPDRIHHIDFEGSVFSVKGPLITPRPPQGQVVVIADEALGVNELADVTLVGAPLSELARAAQRARDAGAVRVFVDLEVLLDGGVPARIRLERLDGVIPWPDRGRLRFVGAPSELVDLVRDLEGVVDGVRVQPAEASIDLALLWRDVAPVLVAEGIVRCPRPGSTLRSTLGLKRPESRYAASAPGGSR